MSEENQDVRIQLINDLKKLFDVALKVAMSNEKREWMLTEKWILTCLDIANTINTLTLNVWQEQLETAKVRLGKV
jgi:hypothetical protein